MHSAQVYFLFFAVQSAFRNSRSYRISSEPLYIMHIRPPFLGFLETSLLFFLLRVYNFETRFSRCGDSFEFFFSLQTSHREALLIRTAFQSREGQKCRVTPFLEPGSMFAVLHLFEKILQNEKVYYKLAFLYSTEKKNLSHTPSTGHISIARQKR